MQVQLLSHEAANFATGKRETLPQYKVVVDGTTVGYKSWKDGSKVCFIARISPLDKAEIEKQVEVILGSKVSSVEPADYDPDKDTLDSLEQDFQDDFDESDVS